MADHGGAEHGGRQFVKGDKEEHAMWVLHQEEVDRMLSILLRLSSFYSPDIAYSDFRQLAILCDGMQTKLGPDHKLEIRRVFEAALRQHEKIRREIQSGTPYKWPEAEKEEHLKTLEAASSEAKRLKGVVSSLSENEVLLVLSAIEYGFATRTDDPEASEEDSEASFRKAYAILRHGKAVR